MQQKYSKEEAATIAKPQERGRAFLWEANIVVSETFELYF